MSEKFTGTLEVTDSDGRTTITLDGEGTLVLVSDDDEESIRLDAKSCNLKLGGSRAGSLSLSDGLDERTVHLDAATGYAHLKGLAGKVYVGGHGEDGSLYLVTEDGKSTVHVDSHASLEIGGHGHYGSLYVADAESRKMISMYGNAAEITLFSGPRQESIRLSGKTGNVYLGSKGQDGDLVLTNKDGETTIQLNGDSGLIHLPNADCAEDFAVAEGAVLEGGDVVVFDRSSALRRTEEAYDRRVAGVISCAGDTRPGIVLGRIPSSERRLPVALVGKVNCKVDAGFGAIDVGDLLTTSPRPGHAMRADDPARAFGAVLGKALRPLEGGDGMIPVLVALR